MESNSVNTASKNVSTGNDVSKAKGIAFCVCFILALVLIVVGNVLTIFLFAVNKRLRKKSFFLVINMAVADLFLGAVSLPIYTYLVGGMSQLWTTEWDTSRENFYRFVDDFFMQAALMTEVMISIERLYAIYWPYKHRALSKRSYYMLTLTVWILAVVASLVLFALFLTANNNGFLYFWLPYTLTQTFIVCGCNIAICRKFQQSSNASQQQNRAASRNNRLTKTLFIVCLINQLSWLPLIIMNILILFHVCETSGWPYFAANVLNFSNSFVNPIIYAFRIPEFKQAFIGLCSRRRKTTVGIVKNINEGNKDYGASVLTPEKANSAQLELALKKDVMDTKL